MIYHELGLTHCSLYHFLDVALVYVTLTCTLCILRLILACLYTPVFHGYFVGAFG